MPVPGTQINGIQLKAFAALRLIQAANLVLEQINGIVSKRSAVL